MFLGIVYVNPFPFLNLQLSFFEYAFSVPSFKKINSLLMRSTAMAMQKLKPNPDKKFRLITRSDMDGLVCAVLLKELGIIEDISFAHPKDMQDGLVDIDETVISTNLPYVPGVHMAFDHHASEVERAGGKGHDNHVIDAKAPSAARVVYDYFGGVEAFPDISEDMMLAVDKADSHSSARKTSSIRRAGNCSALSWMRGQALAVSATSIFPTIN